MFCLYLFVLLFHELISSNSDCQMEQNVFASVDEGAQAENRSGLTILTALM